MSDSTKKTTGRVKWFNKNSGYGFITALDGDRTDEDIFVHHSALCVGKDQFRYLVDGEYISFDWSSSGKNTEEHKWQATEVTGVCGGPLLCETQNDARSEVRDNGEDDGGGGAGEDGSSSTRRYRGGGPRVTDADGVEYRLVRNSGGGGRGKGRGKGGGGGYSSRESASHDE